VLPFYVLLHLPHINWNYFHSRLASLYVQRIVNIACWEVEWPSVAWSLYHVLWKLTGLNVFNF